MNLSYLSQNSKILPKETTILETTFDRLIQKLFRKDDFLSHLAINCNISKYLPGIFKKHVQKDM